MLNIQTRALLACIGVAAGAAGGLATAGSASAAIGGAPEIGDICLARGSAFGNYKDCWTIPSDGVRGIELEVSEGAQIDVDGRKVKLSGGVHVIRVNAGETVKLKHPFGALSQDRITVKSLSAD